jgi:hypothetical protein
MMSKLIFAAMVSIGMALAGCAAIQGIRSMKVEVQLRAPASVPVDPATQLAFRREHTIDGILISATDSSLTNDFHVFRHSFEWRSDDQPKALVVYLSRTSTDQVFLLSIALNAQAGDWTNWRYPDYLETNAVSNLRFNYVPPDRKTNVPPNSFQLRYRIQ